MPGLGIGLLLEALGGGGAPPSVPANNLILKSQEFDNAAWTKARLSVLANAAVAPGGAMAAELVTSDGTTGFHFVETTSAIVTVAATNYTLSLHVKPITQRFVTLSFQGNAGNKFIASTFDLQSAVVTKTGVGASSGTYVNSAIQTLSSGWFRLSVTGNHNDALSFVGLSLADGATPIYSNAGYESYLGSITDTCNIWGAQLEIGISPSTYVPTL